MIHHDRGESFPPQVERFVARSRAGDIRQCPDCGTYFHYERVDDNEVGLEVHTQELSKMPAAKAEALIEEERALDEHFKSMLARRFADVMPRLGVADRRVFDHLIEHRWSRSTLEGIRTRLPDVADVEAALAVLVANRIARRTVIRTQVDRPDVGLVVFELNVDFLELMEIRRQFTAARDRPHPVPRNRRTRRSMSPP